MQYDCIVAFSETGFTADLEAPIGDSARKSTEMLCHGTLKFYPGLSHGMFATHPDVINADLLAFAQS